MISPSQISCNTPTFYIAAIFVKYIYNRQLVVITDELIMEFGYYPLGEKLLWNRSMDMSYVFFVDFMSVDDCISMGQCKKDITLVH